MGKNIEIIIGSPTDYEKLVAYIVVDGKNMAMINQERGINDLIIEFYDNPEIKEIDFDIFIEALYKAKNELLK
jgi:hypothetical protein